MKIIYRINLTLIIINICILLMIVPSIAIYFSGYAFFIPIGFFMSFAIFSSLIQVLMYIIYLFKWNKISDRLKSPFIFYGIIAMVEIIYLLTIISSIWGLDYIEMFVVISMALFRPISLVFLITASFMALFSLYLSKKQYHLYKPDNFLLTE